MSKHHQTARFHLVSISLAGATSQNTGDDPAKLKTQCTIEVRMHFGPSARAGRRSQCFAGLRSQNLGLDVDQADTPTRFHSVCHVSNQAFPIAARDHFLRRPRRWSNQPTEERTHLFVTFTDG